MTEQDLSVDQKVNPEAEVQLRCNRCNKPITPATAVLTETGYRCTECVRAQQRVFDTTKRFDPFLGFIIAAVISFAGSWLAGLLGFFTIFVAPGVGTLITNAVRLAVNRRRSAQHRSPCRGDCWGAAFTDPGDSAPNEWLRAASNGWC